MIEHLMNGTVRHFTPKCTVVDQNFDWSGPRDRRTIPWDDTARYEMHVRGFTKELIRLYRPRSKVPTRGLATKEVWTICSRWGSHL